MIPSFLTTTQRPSFTQGIIVALVASLIGSITHFTLSGFFSITVIAELLVSGLSLAYILYLLSKSKERIGRVSTVLVWSVITIVLWLSEPALSIFVLINLMMIWLARSLYFYSSLLSSGLDLILTVFSFATAIWAFAHTGSLFLTLWCFFLMQALFIFIPVKIGGGQMKDTNANNDQNENIEANFQRAYRDAEAAVRKLSTL